MSFLGAIAAAVPALGGLWQGHQDRKQQRYNLAQQQAWATESQDRQNSFSREMFDLTNQKNKEFWHMKNLYNSPEQQMERFKAAGLNPNLIYGKGTPGASSPITATAPGSAKRDTPDFQAVKAFQMPNLGSYVDNAVKLAQKDSIEAQTELTNTRNATEAVRNAIMTREKAHADDYYRYRSKDKKYQALTRSSERLMKAHMASYSEEFAKEAIQKARETNRSLSRNIELTNERVIGQKLKNDFEKDGITLNTPYGVRMAYKELKSQGFENSTIRQILIGADVASELLKYIAPAGILRGVFNKPGKKGKAPKYNSPGNWKELQRKW